MARATVVSNRQRSLPPALAAVLLISAGCGGSGPEGSTTAVDETGSKVVSVGGQEVTKEAHNRWVSAVELFEKYEEEGWNGQRCGQVASAFEKANDAQGDEFAEAIFMEGLAYERCNNKDEALGRYRRALEASPKLCGARVGIAVNDLDNGNEQKAFTEFKRAINDDPRCKEAYVNLGVIQLDRGEVDNARKNMRRALAIESDYLPAFNQLALVFLKQAQQGDDRKLDLAEIVCRQAQLHDARYAPVYNTWGLVKMERGNIIEALEFFEKARQLDDSMFEAHMNFGGVTLSFRGYQDAQKAFSRALELQPKHYEATLGLGTALRGLEQYEAAEKRFNEAREISPNRPDSYFNLGILYQDYKQGELSDFRTAKKYLNTFVSKAGNKPDYKEPIDEVKRRCRMKDGKPLGDCRPGRLQRIDQTIEALEEMKAMQRMQQQQGGG